MTSARLAEVDGVPVLLADTSGPMRAGLVFRVGRADESLTTGGVTHLVEHLALHRHGVADYHYNGATGPTVTHFLIQGTADDVVTFINGVCASLADLPVSRLATEKKILEAEEASRPVAVNHQMALWRHGSRDFGLLSYPEFGIHTLGPEDVLAWAQNWFTRGNAALWLTGDHIPAGLRVNLPDGQRRALPSESSALPVTPAYFTSSIKAIVLDARVPRTRPAVMYTRALERALFRELRQDGGLSYRADAAYDPDGRMLATITATADALPHRQQDTLDGFLKVLRRLESQPIDQAELEAVRNLELHALRDADIEARLLPRRATDLLVGFPSSSTADLISGFEAATAADIEEMAAIVKLSALLMVPDTPRLTPAGFEAAPTISRYGVTGTKFRSRANPNLTLVRGDDGISLTGPDGSATVLYGECTAMLRWPDGGRHLFGADAISVRIEPTHFALPPAALAELDRAVSAARIVNLPARSPDSIPKPSTRRYLRSRLRTRWLPLRAWLDRRTVRHGGIRTCLVAVALGSVGLVAGILALTLNRPGLWVAAVICGITLLRPRRR